MCSLEASFCGLSLLDSVVVPRISSPAPPSEATLQARLVILPGTVQRMRGDLEQHMFGQCAKSLQAEIINVLTRTDQLRRYARSGVTFENVGPDHNVNDYGRDVILHNSSSAVSDGRDDRSRCCFCLEPYSTIHTAFEITACAHSVGKACLSTWLNSSSLNANTCPHCREELFERRARRPAAHPNDGELEQLDTRFWREIDRLWELAKSRDELGPEAATRFFRSVIAEINYTFFENDVSFCLEYVGGPRSTLNIQSGSWHN
ncbi:uncharacterized protein M421DRAFT_310604 [Didymella exigua CBS 183.55]|uniref:RING-type domain-containing protein n=1 Tax=Didymella exigua CBS 183.55 TaxID=1150837 RepID=A0A6A5R7M2_9PLEO|nr:uncharacterized protein M421DRAFT_310604 [Didymella exigua CBS 183.55]KAF1923633.1 hypothetical protein M421DRAFT_310604 [Didymella exigua CBS 183.55]